jgi:hypothetical protein
MKKILFSVASLLLLSNIESQVIFTENFDGGLTLPSGWTQSNVDGLTVATDLSDLNFGTNAWIILANSSTGSNDAVSTSWYTPAGMSNDWLISPQVAIPATGTYMLSFDAMAPDANYADGFKVYISTGGNTVADFGTSAVLTVAAAPQVYTGYSVDLSSYAGQSIYFAVQNNSNDMFLLRTDNFVVRQPSPDDAILQSASINRYSLINTNNTLALSVKNDGNNPITNLTVNWNDGADHSSVITTSIAPGATASINHPTAVNYALAFEKNLNITITNVNGNTDPVPANNVGTTVITTMSVATLRNPLFEEATGTWCGWCPRGTVGMNYMSDNHPDFVGVAVHNGDPMTVAEYDNAIGAYIGGYPSAVVDRELEEDPSSNNLEAIYNERKVMLTIASADASISISGSTVTVNASASFHSAVTGEYRLGLIIVEDSLSGTESDWAQANYYSGGGSGVMGGFETLGDPVPAADMVYNHVGVALVGGFDGQAGSIPAPVNDGTVATYAFNYTVPTTSHIENMHGIIVIIDNATGKIVNSVKKELKSSGIGISENSKINFNVFPNPSTDFVNVEFEAKNSEYIVSVIDITGKIVKSNSYNNLSGATTVKVDLNDLKSGNYLIGLSTNGESFTQNVVKK